MIYDLTGAEINSAYQFSTQLSQAYDINGNPLMSDEPSPEPEFIRTVLPYDSVSVIDDSVLTQALAQRRALLNAFNDSNGAIPFFIETDAHGRMNEGNKVCHNLAEPTMKYIRNIQLGDYGSYYSNGGNASKHLQTRAGIKKYVPVMGNHEFMVSNVSTDALADLSILVNSFVAEDGIIGSQTYGYYKILDDDYNVKYLVTQGHIPNAQKSTGFSWRMEAGQIDWLINELASNDGYDIVLLQHEPLDATYTSRNGTTTTYSFSGMNIAPILSARKAKRSGVFIDADDVSHSYDFTGCTSDFLCSLHGHHHAEAYLTKETFGFPSYVADWMGNASCSTYGLIDRENGVLMLFKYTRSTALEPLLLDL